MGLCHHYFATALRAFRPVFSVPPVHDVQSVLLLGFLPLVVVVRFWPGAMRQRRGRRQGSPEPLSEPVSPLPRPLRLPRLLPGTSRALTAVYTGITRAVHNDRWPLQRNGSGITLQPISSRWRTLQKYLAIEFSSRKSSGHLHECNEAQFFYSTWCYITYLVPRGTSCLSVLSVAIVYLETVS